MPDPRKEAKTQAALSRLREAHPRLAEEPDDLTFAVETAVYLRSLLDDTRGVLAIYRATLRDVQAEAQHLLTLSLYPKGVERLIKVGPSEWSSTNSLCVNIT